MKRNPQSGFSLLELAIVMVVILILTCMAVPVFLTAQNNAAASTAKKRVMLIWQMESAYQVCLVATPTQCAGTVYKRCSVHGTQSLAGQSRAQGRGRTSAGFFAVRYPFLRPPIPLTGLTVFISVD
jgi:prepilin-type N-terminal cleavage/methylation domain-containing protein